MDEAYVIEMMPLRHDGWRSDRDPFLVEAFFMMPIKWTER